MKRKRVYPKESEKWFRNFFKIPSSTKLNNVKQIQKAAHKALFSFWLIPPNNRMQPTKRWRQMLKVDRPYSVPYDFLMKVRQQQKEK